MKDQCVKPALYFHIFQHLQKNINDHLNERMSLNFVCYIFNVSAFSNLCVS